MNNIAVPGKTGIEQGLQLCNNCGHFSVKKDNPLYCPNCESRISQRIHHSLQKTFAFLITATIFIIPANLYPITYFLKNNVLYPDSIFSGILSLIDSGMVSIAIIVFIASIIVPFFKILALAVIALCVHFQHNLSPQKQLWAFKLVEIIGKWSILDLFVISIMVAVFDKGQMLSVYPGFAATSFTIVVLTTLFAAHSFDTRLIWDLTLNHDQSKQ
ncbi:paraquat-inducible protein A [Psychromonas sp. MME1]|uniref:paraquat-inducible protein A n=1 Tax=Psychromonas sp. MME1 TaxID=3231032 RepID=UPI0034E2DB3B